MRDFFDNWLEGLEFLLADDLISYYTYFTMVFAEIAFLWTSFPKLALPFTCILIASILNIVVCSFFKGCYEYTKREVTWARIYAITFILIFIIGMFFNWLANIILFVIPLLVTALWIKIREFQDTVYIGKVPIIIRLISKVFSNPVFLVMSQIVVIGLPFALLSIGIFTTSLTIFTKIAILVTYAVIAPYIAYFEDCFATCNIFELAYDITWNGEDE